jgi:two-component sensor histidine kinase
MLMDYTKSSFGKVVKRCLATYALLFPVLFCLAQQPSLTALKIQLQKSKADSNRVKTQLQIGGYFLSKNNPDSAQAYALQAEKLSTSISYIKGLGNSYILSAKTFGFRKDKKQCYAQIQKAIDLFGKNKMYKEAAEAALNMDEQCNALDAGDIDIRITWHKKAADWYHLAGIKGREADVLKELGDLMQVEGKNVEALPPLKQALALYQSIHYPYLQGTYDLIGNVYSLTGNYKEAVKYGLLAVKTAEAVKDTTMQLCTIYNRIGLTYYFTKQFELSQLYFEKSLAIAKKYKDAASITLLSSNLAIIYIKYGKFQKSVEKLKYIDQFYPPKTVSERAAIDGLFLNAYSSLKQYDKAKPYCDKLKAASAKIEWHSDNQELIQHAMAFFYVTFKNGAEARKYLKNFRTLSIEHNNLANQAHCYLLEFKLDSTENKFPAAIEAYRKYTATNDSLLNAKKSREIAQLEIQYQNEKKDQELKIKEQNIQLLTKQGELQKANIVQENITRNLIIAGAVLLALLLGLNYNRYRLKQRVNQKLQKQQNEISQKNQSLTTLVQEKDNLLEEKEWLMKEIHHRVKNNLQIVISLLNTQSNYITNDIAFNAIRESQHRMQSISLIHQKLYQSENLALVNMQAYINDLVDYLRESFDTGTLITFETDIIAAEFDVTRAVPLGLILNEAITNSIKYAFKDGRDGKIRITMQETDHNTYILKICDNGSGITSPQDITKSKTLGMSLIRGLSKQVGGSFRMENNNGLTVIIEFTNDQFIKAV